MSKAALPALLLLLLVLAVAAPALAGETVVLFDAGHGQRFFPDRDGDLDLSRMSEVFRAEGISLVRTDTPFSAETLAPAAGVILSGPFSPFSPAEIEALNAYVERGGVLAIMLHIAPPAAALIERLGGAVANGVVREAEQILDGNPLNFRVTRFAPHPLLAGVDAFTLHGGWPLLAQSPGTELIAVTSPGAWVDLDRNQQFSAADPVQNFGLILSGRIGKGAFVVFADDAVFQNRFLSGGNERLAQNLARWFLRRSD